MTIISKANVKLVQLFASLIIMVMVKLAKAMAIKVDVGGLFIVLSFLNVDDVH